MVVNVYRDLINEQVYEYIKDKIIYNEFKPNEKIDVTQLAQTLKVSKTPVTTALSRLQRDGYVVILPQSGTFVRSHSIDELKIIFKARASLERTIVETYGEKYDIEKLKEILNNFKALDNSTEGPEKVQENLFALDLSFHAFLIKECDEIIREKVENISDLTKHSRLQYFRMARDNETNIYRIKRNVTLHSNIIIALLEKDYQKAGSLVYEDIITTFDTVKNYA